MKAIEFNLKETRNGTLVELEVVPNSKSFQISVNSFSGNLKVKLRSKALEGKANQELVGQLKELFLSDVSIVKGSHSKRKIVLIEGLPKSKARQALTEMVQA